MSIRIEFGRRELPVGLPTLTQVQDIAEQAQQAAQTAAADAVAAAQPGIADAAAQAAQAAAAQVAPAAADAIRAQVAADAAAAATQAAQDAAAQVAPVAADAIRAQVATDADRAVDARDAAVVVRDEVMIVADRAQLRKNNLTASRAPLPTDDASQGYEVGSRWLWQGHEWTLANAASGVWRSINVAGDNQGAALIGYAPGLPGTVQRDVQGKLNDTISVKDFGAVGDGTTDDSPAFTAMWQAIRDRIEDLGASGYVCHINVIVPAAKYRIAQSIDWTGAFAWNITVLAEGAVLVGECAGKAVIDACSTRGLHIHGLMVHGSDSLTPPSCAILVGPSRTQTCGNNCFMGVKTSGSFSITAFANLGSETTVYHNCYFSNSHPGGYSYAADGRNTLGLTSDYVDLRAAGAAVSFTQNSFYSCQFRKHGGGDGIYMEHTNGWSFDAGCYYLTSSGANFRILQTNTGRNSNLSIRGLFETAQSPGLEYCIRFIVEQGVFTGLNGFEFVAGAPHAKVAIFRLETPSGDDLSAGSMRIGAAYIRINGHMAPGGSSPVLFSGSRLEVLGDLHCANGAMINLAQLMRFQGVVHTADSTAATFPATGSHSYLLFDATTLGGQVARFGGVNGQIGLQGGAAPVVRVEGPSADYDLRLQGKGAGAVRFGTWASSGGDQPVSGYITIKDASGTLRKLAVIP